MQQVPKQSRPHVAPSWFIDTNVGTRFIVNITEDSLYTKKFLLNYGRGCTKRGMSDLIVQKLQKQDYKLIR